MDLAASAVMGTHFTGLNKTAPPWKKYVGQSHTADVLHIQERHIYLYLAAALSHTGPNLSLSA